MLITMVFHVSRLLVYMAPSNGSFKGELYRGRSGHSTNQRVTRDISRRCCRCHSSEGEEDATVLAAGD